MDYERRYKEALEWMRSVYDELHGATKEDAEHYFPELLESKDEGIRKTLIAFFRDWERTKSHCWNVNVSDIIAWLEKQGENKKLDPDKVIAWLVANICDFEYYVKLFKKDFKL